MMKNNTKYEILTPNGFESFDGVRKIKKKSIEIFFDNGLSIRGSFEHLIFDIDNNPIQLKKLKKGDKIKSHDGYLVVNNIKKHYNKINLYDIVNSGKDHIYITNDVISHNCDFLGSGDNVIPKDILENIKKNMMRPPTEQYMAGLLWQWKKPIAGHRYIMGCLPPGEKVLTENGLLDINEININHKLVNADGEYISIVNTQEYDVVNEDLFEIKVDNTFRTTKFTGEHPILSSKPILKRNYKKNIVDLSFNQRYWDFDFKYTKTNELSIGDWLKVPNIYKKNLNFDINDKWIYNNDVRRDFNIETPLGEKEFWWIIGLWLGDGWLEQNGHAYCVVICFNKKEKYYLDKYKKLISKLFRRQPSIRERDSIYEVEFNCKELYLFILDNFGRYSHGKKISEWVKFIPIQHKKELIKGYFDSDGCWYKQIKNGNINSAVSFVSVNLELLEAIQDILFSIGIVSGIKKLRSPGTRIICNKECQTRLTYELRLANYDSLKFIDMLNDNEDIKLNKFDISDFHKNNSRIISSCHLSNDENYIFFRIKNIGKSKYTGKVYNFETDTHSYMCHHITTHNCDTSRGDSEDYSAINIIDFDDREQVLEYIGKMAPDDLGAIAYKWGKMYSAFCVIDITGGMGIATARKMQELGYKDLFIDGINTKDIWSYDKNILDKIPGINFNNKRAQIIATFEEQLRHGFIIRSERLTEEINTFVYINGRPDHMKGRHDDSIMSIAIAMYAGEICFNQLTRNENQNKAMLDAWSLSERSYDVNKSFYSYGTALDAVGGMATDNERTYHQRNPMNVPKEAYKEYSWLFGIPKPK